jgi:CPA1 family monovalent cation:H+ antiporter
MPLHQIRLFVRSRLKNRLSVSACPGVGRLARCLALALALALPDIPERQEIIVVSFAVVAFSIFVQGLTMPWLIRRLGLQRDDNALPAPDAHNL